MLFQSQKMPYEHLYWPQNALRYLIPHREGPNQAVGAARLSSAASKSGLAYSLGVSQNRAARLARIFSEEYPTITKPRNHLI